MCRAFCCTPGMNGAKASPVNMSIPALFEKIVKLHYTVWCRNVENRILNVENRILNIEYRNVNVENRIVNDTFRTVKR